jgi:hypothetical protein
MKPASTRTTLQYRLRMLKVRALVLWWDFLDYAELTWQRFVANNIVATDPKDGLLEQVNAWAPAFHIAGRNDRDIIENLLSDPRTFARKEMIS